MILTFLVRNQTLTYLDTKLVPRIGSAEYLQLKFKFITSDWVNLRKTIQISSGEYSESYILESDIFDVPTYYTQQGSFDITFLGDRESQVVPTNVVTVKLSESNRLWTAEPPDPQNSAYIELLNSIGNLNDLTTGAKNNLVAAINEAAQTGGGGGGSAFSPQLIATLVADGTTTSILQNIDVAYPAIYTVAIIGDAIADTENKGQYLYAKFGASDMYASAVDVRGIQTVNNHFTQQFVAVTFALDSEKHFHVIGKAENNASNTSNWMVGPDGTKILKNAIIFYSSTSKIIPAGYTCSVWRWA